MQMHRNCRRHPVIAAVLSGGVHQHPPNLSTRLQQPTSPVCHHRCLLPRARVDRELAPIMQSMSCNPKGRYRYLRTFLSLSSYNPLRSYYSNTNPTMTTLENTLQQSSSTAIIVPGPPTLTVSFTKLRDDVKAFQRKLAKLGVSPQSAVSIALPNSYPFIVAFLAAAWQRAVAAPLNPAYKQSEFEFYIDDLSSALVLVPQGQAEGLAVQAARKYNAAVAECYLDPKTNEVVLDVKEHGKLAGHGDLKVEVPKPEDTALVLHTSGTTGRPKAVPLTHRNLTRTMKNVQDTYQLSSADRTMLVMPLFHVHGLLAGFLAPLASGGSVVVPGAFSAGSFWNQFTTHKANWYTAVPTIHQILLKSPKPSPLPKIRFIRSCSSPLSPKVFHDLEAAFGAPVLEAYAMTEASHQMASRQTPARLRRNRPRRRSQDPRCRG
jgi:acyl-CoA synthetase (AMP-forming)/AMP-acid ligase II